MSTKHTALTQTQLEDIYYSSRPSGPPEYYSAEKEYLRLYKLLNEKLDSVNRALFSDMFHALAKTLEYENMYYISLGWQKRGEALQSRQTDS